MTDWIHGWIYITLVFDSAASKAHLKLHREYNAVQQLELLKVLLSHFIKSDWKLCAIGRHSGFKLTEIVARWQIERLSLFLAASDLSSRII